MASDTHPHLSVTPDEADPLEARARHATQQMMQAALEAVSKPQKRLNNRYLEPGFEITSRNISTHLDTISPAAVFCGVCGRISEAFLPGTCLLLAATREGEIASGGGQSSSLQVDQDHLEMLAGEEAV